MKNIDNLKLAPTMTILEAIQTIDTNAMQIGLVVDAENHLLGTVTDGDVRRALLRSVKLDEPVERIMNASPKVISANESAAKIMALVARYKLRQIPIVDAERRLLGLKTMDELVIPQRHDNWVILMAGGLGTRLGELTKACPKPLIPVGGKPLLETIVDNFKENGFYKFFFAVNYKAEMIEDHFADGAEHEVEIKYLRENKRLGTAGALSLLEELPDKPIIVMNGDLLTKVNFQQLLEYHMQENAMATMCVREYSFQVPYGVVCIENSKLTGIDEKPVQNFFVSAGIYVIEPAALKLIPNDTYYDMPSLFDALIKKQLQVNVFPIREYWIDIGQQDDFERANCEYEAVFR